MILAPGVPGVAFGTRHDGDARRDASARTAIAQRLGITDAWAYVDQVHGSDIVPVSTAGNHGEADGLTTATVGLPLAIGTADCVPVALVGDTSVAMLHAGWRGVAAGIVAKAVDPARGQEYAVAVIGPHIGPCCYEVSQDVVDAIGGFAATTSSGTLSVDLGAAVAAQIGDGIRVVDVSACTKCDDRFASHRRDGTKVRQVSIVWL